MNHQVAIQPTPFLWWCHKHTVPVYSSMVNSSLFKKSPKPLFSSHLLWVKIISLYYVIQFLTSSITQQVELWNWATGALRASLSQRWWWWDRIETGSQGVTLPVVPALPSSLPCQQGHGTSDAKGAWGLLCTSTLVAWPSQRTPSLASAPCALPAACEKENKCLAWFFLLEIPTSQTPRMHTMWGRFKCLGKVVFQRTSLEGCQRQPGASEEQSVYCGQRGNIEGGKDRPEGDWNQNSWTRIVHRNDNPIMSLWEGRREKEMPDLWKGSGNSFREPGGGRTAAVVGSVVCCRPSH